jgi:hypothetical protein
MGRYLKISFWLHAVIFVLLAAWTFLAPLQAQKHMKFVILPKGTSLDAVLTQEVADAINKPPDQDPGAGSAIPATPAASPTASAATPVPTPVKLATPSPVITAAPTAEPEKTIAVASKGTPKPSPSPTATAAPTKTPVPKPTATPKSAKATPNVKVTPNAKDAKKYAKPTPKTSKPTPKPSPAIASAYDLKNEGGNRLAGADLPKQTPSNVRVGQAAPGQEIGVPGVPEGVEGAPLPLDRNQSMLSMLYTTRARMKIQANFTVPPGVNDPNLTCVIEWEILPDGTIRNPRVAESTGVAQYDACALESLVKTANLGPLPPEFGNRTIWTSLTFVFAGDESATLRAQN